MRISPRCSRTIALLPCISLLSVLPSSSVWAAPAPSPAPETIQGMTWGLDSTHCKALFVSTHDGVSPVTGWFNKIRGTVKYDGKNLAKAQVSARIDASSLNSGFEYRDMHLRSDHFFDIKKYPEIAFESTEITPVSPGKFKMTGNLEIRGIKKKVTLDCSGPRGPVTDKDHKQTRIGVLAKTTIAKKDFGMTWNSEIAKGVFMVSEQADITLEIEAIQVPTK